MAVKKFDLKSSGTATGVVLLLHQLNSETSVHCVHTN